MGGPGNKISKTVSFESLAEEDVLGSTGQVGQRALTHHGEESASGQVGFYYNFGHLLSKHDLLYPSSIASSEARRDNAEDNVQFIKHWETRRDMAMEDISRSSGRRVPFSGNRDSRRATYKPTDIGNGLVTPYVNTFYVQSERYDETSPYSRDP